MGIVEHEVLIGITDKYVKKVSKKYQYFSDNLYKNKDASLTK